MKSKAGFWVWGVLAALALAGCGDEDEALFGGAGFLGDAGTWSGGEGEEDSPPPSAQQEGQTMDGGQGQLPAEVEYDVQFELPRAGKRFVFVASPETDNVAVIDAENLSIRTAPAGEEPTFLQTLRGTDTAVVLNVGSEDATVVRATASAIETSTVDVATGCNAIAVAPDGQHAVVYYNSRYSSAGTSSGRYQDVTVIAFSDEGDSAVDMSVGFRPSAVFFSADGDRAFVVTEEGVSVLDFAEIAARGRHIAANVSLGYSLDEIPSDVSVTPDGRYALSRLENDSVVHLVDLNTGSIRALDLVLRRMVAPGSDGSSGDDDDTDAGADAESDAIAVTDLDLAPSGTYAAAVLRARSKVLRIPVPGAFDDPSQIEETELEGVLIGSISIGDDGRHALLYTTAVADERITVLDLNGERPPATVQLQKAVKAVTIAPQSQTALVIHAKKDGDPGAPGIGEDEKIDRSHGYSLLQMSTGFRMLQVTQADVGPFAIVPDGSYLFLLLRDDQRRVQQVHRADLGNFEIDAIELARPPVSVGAVPQSEKVFVSQEHADGMITFIDWKTGESQWVIGFELNSRIDELESKTQE